MSKRIIGNPATTPMAMPDLDTKVDKIYGKGLSTNDFTDEYKNQVELNALNVSKASALADENRYHIGDLGGLDTENVDNLVGAINELRNNMVENARIAYSVDEIYDEWMEIPTVEVTKMLINPTPIEDVPSTLEANKQYNFKERTSLSLVFPTFALDGDVIYLTFKSGATPTALTIDTTNTCDIECIPEATTGYEIFGKYNGSIWIINYSEYTVSEG